MKIKIKISKLYKFFIRDEWGNLKECYWNKMVKEEIIKLKNHINENPKRNHNTRKQYKTTKN